MMDLTVGKIHGLWYNIIIAPSPPLIYQIAVNFTRNPERMTAMMEKYEMRRQIGPSICDASGKLSHAEAFGLFMDIASFHAEQIGVGLGAMAQRVFFG